MATKPLHATKTHVTISYTAHPNGGVKVYASIRRGKQVLHHYESRTLLPHEQSPRTVAKNFRENAESWVRLNETTS